MKKHLVITCLAYFFFGIGLTVQNLGIKAGIGFWPTVILYVFGLLFLGVAAFTSLDKLMDFIAHHEANDKFDKEFPDK